MKKYLYILLFLVTFPFFANAQQTILGKMASVGNDSYQTDAQGEGSLLAFAGSIIKVFLSMLGVIFLIIVISAGYTWMMANGDSTKIATAKSKIWHAIIGLLIVVSAYAIQSYVFGKLVYKL